MLKEREHEILKVILLSSLLKLKLMTRTLHRTDQCILFQAIAKNCVKFLLRDRVELTNEVHCNSQRETLVNWLSVIEGTYLC